MLAKLLLVGLGGAAGSMVRYGASLAGRALWPGAPGSPSPSPGALAATLVVNLAGCLILSFAAALFVRRAELPDELRVLVAVGFCGGLTTYSTFNQELYTSLVEGRAPLAFGYFVATVALCAGASLLGTWLARA